MKANYNTLKIDYMQVSLLAVAHFITNFYDILNQKGRYIYDFTFVCDNIKIDVSVTYYPTSARCNESNFSFSCECEDVDIRLHLKGSYSLACSYAKDIADEYCSRVFTHQINCQ